MLPHFGGKLLAHLPRIVARETQRIDQRGTVEAVECERLRGGERIVRIFGEFLARQGRDDAQP